MTRPEAPSRPRRRGFAAAALALVVALLAVGSPLAASADELPTTGTISGTVTTPDGQPIVGALVIKFFSPQSAVTDATGYYELTGVGLSNYDLGVSLTGYQPSSPQSGILTAESPSATVNFVLVPFAVGTGSISGVITVDGIPLADVGVFAYDTSGQSANTVADANGHYELTGLANGSWSVFVAEAENYQFPNLPPVILTDGATTATQDLPLTSWPTGTSSISGVITDAETGAPIPNAYLHLNGTTIPRGYSVATDETGGYSFGQLPADTYYFSLWQPGYLNVSRDIPLAAGQAVTANLALIPTNSTISGHVEGPNGVPAAGIYVSAATSSGASAGSTTDANGDYVITQVGAATYTVTVGGVGTPYKVKEKTVTAVANANVVANFSLKKRTTGYITGMVWGPDGEYYAKPVCVTLYSSKNKKVVAETVTFGENFGDGTYTFDDVKPGSYTVRIKDCDHDPATKYNKLYLGGVKKYKNATFVTIVAGQDSYQNDITLTRRGNH